MPSNINSLYRIHSIFQEAFDRTDNKACIDVWAECFMCQIRGPQDEDTKR